MKAARMFISVHIIAGQRCLGRRIYCALTLIHIRLLGDLLRQRIRLDNVWKLGCFEVLFTRLFGRLMLGRVLVHRLETPPLPSLLVVVDVEELVDLLADLEKMSWWISEHLGDPR